MSAKPLSSLNLFPEYTRASYLAATGEDAPTYDGTRKTKTWRDPATSHPMYDRAVLVTYTSYVRQDDGSYAETQLTMTALEASTVNLPGLHSYPKYDVVPTRATMNGQPINSVLMVPKADAIKLARALGLSVDSVSEPENTVMAEYSYPNDEIRRPYQIFWQVLGSARSNPLAPGVLLAAGLLIAEENANGVGAPGHWNQDGGEPNWISDLPSSILEGNPAWPVPQRLLTFGESIQAGLFGATVVSGSDATPAPVNISASLGSIEKKVDRIVAALNA